MIPERALSVLDLPGCRWQRCPRRPPIYPKHRNRACSPACAEFRRWRCFRHVKPSFCYPSVTHVAYIANIVKLSVCLKGIIIFRQIDYISNYLHVLGRKRCAGGVIFAAGYNAHTILPFPTISPQTRQTTGRTVLRLSVTDQHRAPTTYPTHDFFVQNLISHET